MPIGSIETQPAAASVYAAYRPIYFAATATATAGGVPPAVYCDIYFGGVFYKTLSKTAFAEPGLYEFDIQDAAQEYLGKFIADNGGGAFVDALPLVTECYVMIRSSGFDDQGYILPEGTAPIQATGDTAAVAGSGGTTSNTFTIVNSALQHDQAYAVANALAGLWARFNAVLSTWGATTYPLTHRPSKYKVCADDSDYFPILTDDTPAGLILHYRSKDSADFTDSASEIICNPVGTLPSSLPNAALGVPYNFIFPLSGSAPFSLDAFVGPVWMSASIDGSNNLVLSGTPGIADVGTGIVVQVTVTNCAGGDSAGIDTTLTVLSCAAVAVGAYAFPDAKADQPYLYIIPLTGDAPFELDGSTVPAWMTVTIVGSTVQFTGTPANSDTDTGVTVAATIINCFSNYTVNVSDTIDVLPSDNFVLNAAFNFRIDTVTGDGVPGGAGPTPLNGTKKTHQIGGAGGSYLVIVTGTIVTTTKITAYLNGTPVDCVVIGTVVGTVITAGGYALDVPAFTEDDEVRFSVESGVCTV